MSRIFAVAFAGAVASLTNLAAAAAPTKPISLFDVTIGAPVKLPTCDLRKVKSMCLIPDAEITAKLGKGVEVWYDVPFADGAKPTFASNDHFQVAIKAGIVSQVVVYTTGAAAQRDVLAILNKKFGWPKNGASVEHRIIDGADVPAFQIKWKLAGGYVVYIGQVENMTTGVIAAATREAVDTPSTQPTTPAL